ncbi:MAG: ribokinase [Spirochaetales bacterium]
MKTFCVVGSLNMDMVTRLDHFPRPGETLTGQSFTIFPGGKGANQAVALARLGCDVVLVGSVGDDFLGHRYRDTLRQESVGVDSVVLQGGETGTASIQVNATGENTIVVVPGANAKVTPEVVRLHAELIARSELVLLQLEIPIESTLEAARIARAAGRTVLLDPAPARPLPDELWGLVSILTPNETEASLLSGCDASTEEGLRAAAHWLVNRGVPTVVIKAGSRGAYLATSEGVVAVPGFPVEVVDTVAAGDSFNAGLACALGKGQPLVRAIRFANAVAALSTTSTGAQSAMPTYAAARELFESWD